MVNKKQYTKNPGDLHLIINKKMILLKAMLIFCVISVAGGLISVQLSSTFYKDEEIHIQKDYIIFQNNLQQLFQTAENIVVGYNAFYMTIDDITQEETETFLEYISQDYMDYVRNIGIIEDTTIIYNYPYDENQSTIGVDLSTVEGQSESVLKVKNDLVEVSQGPIDLVQGGMGYIIRVPILEENGDYWGQVSIVLDADAIDEKILEYAYESGIDICIYKLDDLTEPIIGDEKIMDQNPYDFELTERDWIVYAVQLNNNNYYYLIKGGLIITSILSSLLISYAYMVNSKKSFRLRYTMARDQLTDLYNRRYLEEVQNELTRSIERDKIYYGLLHMDIDNFKDINDNYGHLKGDEALVEISRILKKISRKNELVFRIGGDEFLVLIPKVKGMDEMSSMRQRYIVDFSKELEKYEYNKIIGISIGIAMLKNGEDFDAVLKAADIDMYEQKVKNKQKKGL